MEFDFSTEIIAFQDANGGDLLAVVDGNTTTYGIKIVANNVTALLKLKELGTDERPLLQPARLANLTLLRLRDARLVPASKEWASLREADPKHAELLIAAEGVYVAYETGEGGVLLANVSDGALLQGRMPSGIIVRGWSIEIGDPQRPRVLATLRPTLM